VQDSVDKVDIALFVHDHVERTLRVLISWNVDVFVANTGACKSYLNLIKSVWLHHSNQGKNKASTFPVPSTLLVKVAQPILKWLMIFGKEEKNEIGYEGK